MNLTMALKSLEFIIWEAQMSVKKKKGQANLCRRCYRGSEKSEEERQWIFKVTRVQPLGTVNACVSTQHGNPSASC